MDDKILLVCGTCHTETWLLDAWMTVVDAARLMGQSPSTVRARAATGHLAGARKVGTTWIVPRLTVLTAWVCPGCHAPEAAS